MTRMLKPLAVAALITSLVGCVSQEKYNALKLERDALAEQLGKAQTEASTARAEADLAKQNFASLGGQGSNYAGLIQNLTQQNATLQAQLEELNRRYGEAMSRGGSGPLPQQLSNELTAFANANPDLVDFDAARGIVKFKSDVTFAKGDAALQAKAKDVINRFATILNSSSASGYELLIAGHTDNTPVVNPATIAAGNKDNWYLSAHRAISVAKELMSQGTNPQRIGVIGYADQHQIAPNSSESGKAQNRRVEVLILPTTVRSSGNMATSPRQSAPRTAPNKDGGSSVGADSRPILPNK